jgi:hypothetical protein
MRNAVMVLTGVCGGLLAACLALASGGANALPKAHAQTADSGNGTMILGTGGGMQGQTDLCWVLSKVKPARGKERTVLAMYRAKKNGEYFDLEDVRFIDADLRVIELRSKAHEYTVEKVLKALPKEDQEDLRPQATPPQNP